MNSGIIASRYAKALLKFVQENQAGEKVYSQACVLMESLDGLPRLRAAVEGRDDLSPDRRVELLSLALGEPLAEELVRFMHLLDARRRTDCFSRILAAFVEQYRSAAGIKVGRVVSARGNEGLKRKVEEIWSRRTGADVRLQEDINPDIIGGFVLEVDGYRLDASIEGQFRRIRRGLIDDNDRIV